MKQLSVKYSKMNVLYMLKKYAHTHVRPKTLCPWRYTRVRKKIEKCKYDIITSEKEKWIHNWE